MHSEVHIADKLLTCDGRPCSISSCAQVPDESLHLPCTPPALNTSAVTHTPACTSVWPFQLENLPEGI